MKIHQLPDGARFEYEGEEYVKTGPLFASGKGGPRLIPKYAVLKPLDPLPPQTTAPKADSLPRRHVLDAFGKFFAECQHLVPAERQAALRSAKEGFLKAIE